LSIQTTPLTFRLTPIQAKIDQGHARFKVLIAGRRSGKTWYDNYKLIERASAKPGSLNWYIGPVLDDARELMYEPCLDMLVGGLLRSHNATRLELVLANGSHIRGLSADKAKRGRGVDFCVLDEFATWDSFEYVWQQEVRPALADRQGEALFSTTPLGLNHAYDLFMLGMSGNEEWASYTWTTLQGGQVPASEVQAARTILDPRVFRQEFEASFETLQGRVYDNFDRTESVEPVDDTGAELYVGMDFNVNPMSAVIAVRAADEAHIIDSLEIMTSNTEEMAAELRARYPDRTVIACPDPTGRARKTVAPVSVTDFTILERHGFEVRAPRKAPPVVDRVNNTQSMLLSGDGRRRVKVHPRCGKLIRGLDGLTYKEGTSQIDKASGLDHITDALGYLLWSEWNLLENRSLETFTFRI
jgi:hypothetical protein